MKWERREVGRDQTELKTERKGESVLFWHGAVTQTVSVLLLN